MEAGVFEAVSKSSTASLSIGDSGCGFQACRVSGIV